MAWSTGRSPLSVAPPALDHLRVLHVGRSAEGDDLRPLGTGLERAHHVTRHADGVPLTKVHDLVADLDPRAARHHQVDLLLVAMPVAEGDTKARLERVVG